MLPYTPLFPVQAKSADVVNPTVQRPDESAVRFVISNVEEENDQYELWMQTIEAADPDILVVLEIDDRWVRFTQRLIEKYPHRVIRPQSNWYGMMMLSRLPIQRHEVRYWVQDDVPSIDADVRLKDQMLVRVVAVHPRPPEPIRGNHSTARDAELTLWGQELADEKRPVIICGDLNDVAWSPTTRLFLRTSGLLDPRRGRGFLIRTMQITVSCDFQSITFSSLRTLRSAASSVCHSLVQITFPCELICVLNRKSEVNRIPSNCRSRMTKKLIFASSEPLKTPRWTVKRSRPCESSKSSRMQVSELRSNLLAFNSPRILRELRESLLFRPVTNAR